MFSRVLSLLNSGDAHSALQALNEIPDTIELQAMLNSVVKGNKRRKHSMTIERVIDAIKERIEANNLN